MIVQRLIDVMLAFPGILLAIVLVSALGVGLENVMLAVGIVSIPTYARIVRGSVLALKEAEFVQAARAAGARDAAIIVKHILPNCMAPIIVQSSLQVGSAICGGGARLSARRSRRSRMGYHPEPRQAIAVAPHTFTGPAIMLWCWASTCWRRPATP